MSKVTPIRIFITQEARAKLSYLAGDALETPNKLGAEFLTREINKNFDLRSNETQFSGVGFESGTERESGL